MARRQNFSWSAECGCDSNSSEDYHKRATLNLMEDIRDELHALRRIFECVNFQRIPRKLDVIVANTAKPKKKSPIKLRRVA